MPFPSNLKSSLDPEVSGPKGRMNPALSEIDPLVA